VYPPSWCVFGNEIQSDRTRRNTRFVYGKPPYTIREAPYRVWLVRFAQSRLGEKPRRMKLTTDLSLDKEILKTHAYCERARSTLTDSGYEKTEVKVPRVFKFLDMAGSVLHTIDDPEDQLPIPVYRQEITIGSDRMRVESVMVRSTGPQTCYVCVQTKAPKD